MTSLEKDDWLQIFLAALMIPVVGVFFMAAYIGLIWMIGV